MVKGCLENEDSSASLWFFIDTVPGPPSDAVSHRFCQVLADPGGIQEVTEHYKVFGPLVLPLIAFFHVYLLTADDQPLGQTRRGTGVARRWESQVDVWRKSRLEVVERGLVEDVCLVFILVNVLSLKRRLAPDRPKFPGMVELWIVQVGLPRSRMAWHQETDRANLGTVSWEGTEIARHGNLGAGTVRDAVDDNGELEKEQCQMRFRRCPKESREASLSANLPLCNVRPRRFHKSFRSENMQNGKHRMDEPPLFVARQGVNGDRP